MNKIYKKHNDVFKCIYVHVPKVAGISIETSLFKEKVGHHTIMEYKNEDENRFFNYYKFSFVRNPYDRLRSAFYYLKKGGRNEHDKQWADNNLFDIECLEEFIDRLKDDTYRKVVLNQVHFRPQYQFVCVNDFVAVDFLGRYESLSRDFSLVADKLGSDAVLSKMNSSEYMLSLNDEYSESMKKIVFSVYEKDFELLDYA